MTVYRRADTGEEFDPFTYDMSGKEASAEARAMRRYLQRGDWVSGPALIAHIGQVIPDGVALRWTQDNVVDTASMTPQDMVKHGRRRLAMLVIKSHARRGVVEIDPPELSRAMRKLQEGWKVRDRYPGAMGTKSAAIILGVREAMLATWIRRGDLPTPPRHDPGGPYFITPALMAVLQRAVPHWRGTRWAVDPRSLWSEDAATAQACPHCGGKLTIEVVVGTPYSAPAAQRPTEPVASDPSEERSDAV